MQSSSVSASPRVPKSSGGKILQLNYYYYFFHFSISTTIFGLNQTDIRPMISVFVDFEGRGEFTAKREEGWQNEKTRTER